jgi:hypothetical protein
LREEGERSSTTHEEDEDVAKKHGMSPAATSGRRRASPAATSAEEKGSTEKNFMQMMQEMQAQMQAQMQEMQAQMQAQMQEMQAQMQATHAEQMQEMQAQTQAWVQEMQAQMQAQTQAILDQMKETNKASANNEKIALSQEASIKHIDIQDLEDNVKVEHAQERREVQAEDTFRGSLPKDPDIVGKKLRGKSRSSSNNRACNQKWRSAGSHNLHRPGSGRTSISRMSLDQKPQKGRQRRVHATKDGQKWRSAGSHNLHRSGRTSISRMSLDQKPQKGRQRRVHAIKDGQVSALIMDLMPEYKFGDKPP